MLRVKCSKDLDDNNTLCQLIQCLCTQSTLDIMFFPFRYIVEDAGGKCLPCVVDIREEEAVLKAVEDGVRAYGGIDILINNASAISLTGTLQTPMKR